jgi:hypothetical protein
MVAGKKRAIALAGLFLATLLWLLGPAEKGSDTAADQSPVREQSTNAPENPQPSALLEPNTAKQDSAVQMLPPLGSVQTSTKKLGPDEFVAETLKRPDRPMLPSKIPPLSDAQVDELVAAYMQIGKPTQKSALLWALGFSQNDRAFDTLRYTMTSEYSGAVLSTADNAAQLQVVPLIGVLSRSSDRAWQFLVNLSRPDAWGRIDTWSEDYLTTQYKSEERSIAQVRSTLQGEVITALSASGRPEFMTWANSLYQGGDDPATFDQHHANAVEYGVFQATYIAEHGIEAFYDNVMYDTRQGGSAYSRWSLTDEGKRWYTWWEDQATQAVKRDQENAGK